MKYIYYTLVYVLFLCAPLISNSQDAHPIFPELNDQEALDSLVFYYKPTQVLNYGNARDFLYGTVYNVNDSVECVYSGHKLFLPTGVDPSTFLFNNGSSDGINSEHTFPRSKGASEESGNAFSDMHHLFPTRSQVNSGRENFPYAEIPDEESTHWYYQNEVENLMPIQNINLYSERVNGWFEPKEAHKGNAARAMFYFYTMYKAAADEADPFFFDIQKETLCKWNKKDPVDEKELNRTYLIAEKQDGFGNPFVLDNTLVDRCYCSEFTTTAIAPTPPNNPVVQVYPNPISSLGTIIVESLVDKSLLLVFYNSTGSLSSIEPIRISKGENKVTLSKLVSGTHIYKVVDESDGKIVDNGVVIVL